MSQDLKQSQELTNFYKDIQQWLDNGRREHEVFRSDQGLCYNLNHYIDYIPDMTTGPDYSALYEFESQLRAAGLPLFYPFNEGGSQFYFHEMVNSTIFQNPFRLAWVKHHATPQEPV